MGNKFYTKEDKVNLMKDYIFVDYKADKSNNVKAYCIYTVNGSYLDNNTGEINLFLEKRRKRDRFISTNETIFKAINSKTFNDMMDLTFNNGRDKINIEISGTKEICIDECNILHKMVEDISVMVYDKRQSGYKGKIFILCKAMHTYKIFLERALSILNDDILLLPLNVKTDIHLKLFSRYSIKDISLIRKYRNNPDYICYLLFLGLLKGVLYENVSKYR